MFLAVDGAGALPLPRVVDLSSLPRDRAPEGRRRQRCSRRVRVTVPSHVFAAV